MIKKQKINKDAIKVKIPKRTVKKTWYKNIKEKDSLLG